MALKWKIFLAPIKLMIFNKITRNMFFQDHIQNKTRGKASCGGK